LDALERTEASLVWDAQEKQLPVEHRSDCSPQAILSVRLVTLPPNGAAHGTSPGLSWAIRTSNDE
jgi:hypothetical protein